jgi:cell cycle checkpoint protein
MVTVIVSDNGLKFTVEDAKSAQATAYVEAKMFREFVFNEATAVFRINLTTLLDCLQIFGSSSSSPEQTPPAMRMCYSGQGSSLSLLLEDGVVVTDCSIVTLVADEILDFDFNSANVLSKIIMKSEYLKEAFVDIDTTSETMEFKISHTEPQLRISTYGEAGRTHVDYPNITDVMETFECREEHTNSYRLSLLKSSIKALVQSSKVSIRTDSRGFLSLQFLIKSDDGQVSFVDYLCAPQEAVD